MNDKRERWAEIQARAPGLAELLTALRGEFGKVELVSVRFRDGADEAVDVKCHDKARVASLRSHEMPQGARCGGG